MSSSTHSRFADKYMKKSVASSAVTAVSNRLQLQSIAQRASRAVEVAKRRELLDDIAISPIREKPLNDKNVDDRKVLLLKWQAARKKEKKSKPIFKIMHVQPEAVAAVPKSMGSSVKLPAAKPPAVVKLQCGMKQHAASSHLLTSGQSKPIEKKEPPVAKPKKTAKDDHQRMASFAPANFLFSALPNLASFPPSPTSVDHFIRISPRAISKESKNKIGPLFTLSRESSIDQPCCSSYVPPSPDDGSVEAKKSYKSLKIKNLTKSGSSSLRLEILISIFNNVDGKSQGKRTVEIGKNRIRVTIAGDGPDILSSPMGVAPPVDAPVGDLQLPFVKLPTPGAPGLPIRTTGASVGLLKSPIIEMDQRKYKSTSVSAVNVGHFQDLMATETKLMEDLCSTWRREMKNLSLTEEGLGKIRTTIVQTELLMAQRFKQFTGLVDDVEFKRSKKTCIDLQEIWDMIYRWVEDVNTKFSELKLSKIFAESSSLANAQQNQKQVRLSNRSIIHMATRSTTTKE